MLFNLPKKQAFTPLNLPPLPRLKMYLIPEMMENITIFFMSDEVFHGIFVASED
jgi:hypothetical protein